MSARQSERLLEHFVAGTPARTAAELAGVNRNTARLFYHHLREIIARQLAQASPLTSELEIDHACFEGAAGKTPIFGLLQSGGKIHTVMAPAAARESPRALKAGARPDSIVYADAPDAPQVLDVSALHHERIGDLERVGAGRAQINSIENFWGQAKQHLRRYGGIPRRHLQLFLKECEWRFNYGSPKARLKILKHWIKSVPNRPLSMPAP